MDRSAIHLLHKRYDRKLWIAAEHDALTLDLDALVREGAKRMLLVSLRAEVDEYVGKHVDHRDDLGHALSGARRRQWSAKSGSGANLVHGVG